MNDLNQHLQTKQNAHHRTLKRSNALFRYRLKLSSSLCALLGGVLLASKLEFSRYGFIFLAMSSSQLLSVSIWERDTSMMIYAGSVFLFVDCFGVYRWLIA